jgi:hypothetical protein
MFVITTTPSPSAVDARAAGESSNEKAKNRATPAPFCFLFWARVGLEQKRPRFSSASASVWCAHLLVCVCVPSQAPRCGLPSCRFMDRASVQDTFSTAKDGYHWTVIPAPGNSSLKITAAGLPPYTSRWTAILSAEDFASLSSGHLSTVDEGYRLVKSSLLARQGTFFVQTSVIQDVCIALGTVSFHPNNSFPADPSSAPSRVVVWVPPSPLFWRTAHPWSPPKNQNKNCHAMHSMLLHAIRSF